MRIKKLLTPVLAFTLAASLLISCNSTKTDTSKGSGSSNSPTATPTAAQVNAVNGDINQQTYPISNEKITLKLWYPMAGSMGQLKDFNDSEFFKWYEEKTNIHIEFILPASGTESEAFNLLFASGDMPDMMYILPAGQKYRGGQDKAIEDGYLADLANYLDCAPNYMSWINNGGESGLKRAAYSDTGKMYGMWGIWKTMYEKCLADQGLAIRKDFLDKVGMDVPTTYDEWYNVLVAFRDKLGIEAPLYTSKYGIDPTGEFMGGYQTAPYFYQKDGKVMYGPLDDNYKDYLALLHKWYSEGLLDKNFPTRKSTGITADNDMMLNDKVGALVDYGTRLSDTYVTRGAQNSNFYLVGAQQPVKKEGDIPHYRSIVGDDLMNTYCMLFSADSKHIKEAIRWTDGFYAEDVYWNANYGLENEEGVVWHKAPDGHRIGDYDFRFSNPDGLDSATVLVKYWMKNPPVRAEAAQIEQADANKQAAYNTWSKFESDWFIPSRVTMTSDEATTYSSIYTDIETYVQEYNVKFITGNVSLDTYDSYRDTLKKMGIDKAIAIQQAALDRYYKR